MLYITFLALTSGAVIYIWITIENGKKRAWERKELRRILYEYLKSRIDEIKAANQELAVCLTDNNGYFSNYQLVSWEKQYGAFFSEIDRNQFEHIGLGDDEIAIIREFLHYNEKHSSLRAEFNNQFIENEQTLYKKFFTKIEKHGLDREQQVAVITNEDNNLVIAGASSGKTTTIVGKVKYIIERYKVPPSELLLISFTNKSALTLAQRLDIPGIEVKTFHKFGKDVICEVEGKQPSLFDELQFNSLLTKFFNELIRNRKYLDEVTTFFTNFLKPQKAQDDFDNQGEYFQYLKDQDFTTYKTKEIPVNGRTTYKKEVVKSIEECKIANFLYFNGVNYDYELPYAHDKATQTHRQYKPDFTIKHESGLVYLEHFAINRSGEVPHFLPIRKRGNPFRRRQKNTSMEWNGSENTMLSMGQSSSRRIVMKWLMVLYSRIWKNVL